MIVDLFLGGAALGFIFTMWVSAIAHVVFMEKIWRER